MNEFINKLGRQGVASPNRYWVTFSMPSGIQGDNWGALNQSSLAGEIGRVNNEYNNGPQLSMRCINMSFPPRSLMTVETRHTGVPYKLPYSAMYDEVSFTFVASEDLRERKFFEIWQETVMNVGMNSLNFYNEYISTVEMYQLDKNNNIMYGVKLDEAYPINIGAVDYSYGSQNEFVSVTVSLAYRRWRNIAF
jgi:hypothetical protein